MSDPGGILATPLTIIHRTDKTADIKAILHIVLHNQVERVIVGLPRSLEGGIGGQAEKVKKFAGELGRSLNVPLEFRDERLSTVSARRIMREGKRKRTDRDDAIAAALILQSFLEESR